MSRISGKETKPEILIRKYLFAQGFRYRKNVKDLPGKPDIVIKRCNTTIFVNGCFWHGHEGCLKASLPQTKRDFWKKKIEDNIHRDKKNVSELIADGWKVIIVWQCELKNEISKLNRLNKLVNELKL